MNLISEGVEQDNQRCRWTNSEYKHKAKYYTFSITGVNEQQ